MMEKQSARIINIDIMRNMALFLVVSVHFFLWNGFYSMEMNTASAFFMCVLRTMSMTCVPIFLLISGYLLSERIFIPLRTNYFGRLGYLLFAYLICTTILIFFRRQILHEKMSIADIIRNITSFSQYSWYVAMYAGLFVLIPFINFVWQNLRNEKDELLLIVFVCLLAAIPSVFNIRGEYLPKDWVGIYPITYYFLGAFIKKNEKKIRTGKPVLLLIWLIILAISGGFNYYVSNRDIFLRGEWNDWGAAQNILLSVVLFVIILKIEIKNPKSRLWIYFEKGSKLTYIAFMMSYISDIVMWKIFKDIIPIQNKLWVYLPSVLASFVMSMLFSIPVYIFVDFILKIRAKKE